MKKEIIILAVILIILSLVKPVKIWDEYVYLLNGRYFSGEKLYFEEIRPPVLPLSVSVFYFLHLGFLANFLPAFFLALLSVSLFFYSKDFLKEKAAYPVLLLFSFPVVLLYGTRLLTDVPSAAFFIASLLFMKEHTKNNKETPLYLSFFFASLTALTRYPSGLVYPIIICLYFLFVKKVNWKILLLSQLFFILPILVWLNFIGLTAITNALIWSGLPSDGLYYIYNIPYILGFTILLLPFSSGYKYEKKDLWYLIPLITMLSFFQIFQHKEFRFMIQILPFLSIFLIKSLKFKEQTLTIILLAFIVINFVAVLYSFYQNQTTCNYDTVIGEFTDYFSTKNGTILTNFMPLCSYYLGRSCPVLSYLPEWLSLRISELNASYIAVSNAYSHPPYASNLSYFSNYSMDKLINGTCEQIFIYSIPR
ncbi:Dolichyl-phosphate-mannose-protein mannosyltransferase [Candidatus Tiddalikarchaeum anstoanum]|nr:Dolichyl-phosphate-mannose-protein mannosyltransferase [Candidatus Tiddalikarchaeum anstoanum]